MPTGKPCVEDNSEEAVAARDGFIEICANPELEPEAVCGDGSPYKFTYRPATGESKGLLLYFRGGGACSDYVSCWGLDGVGGTGRRVSTMSNDAYTAPYVLPSLGKTLGIFFLPEATNPLRSYDQVHIAYCTGDIGLGQTQVNLVKPEEASPEAPESITTYFHGHFNIRFALDQSLALFPNPKRIALVGSSAGSHASMGAVPMVAERWNQATLPIAYYGEGAIGVGLPTLNQSVMETLEAYDGVGGHRLIRFAQFSFISDATQRSFAPLAYQEPAAFQAELRTLMEARAAAFPNHYRYFALTGTCHTLAQNPAILQQFTNASGSWKAVQPAVKPNPDLNVGDVNLLTWLAALLENDTIPGSMGNVAGDWETVSTVCPVPGGN